MYVYAIPPVDHWIGWQDAKDLVGDSPYGDKIDPAEFRAFWNQAKVLGRKAGWEGDLSGGPLVAGMLDYDYSSRFMVAWKQSNNGTTFIASEFELPHLGSGWTDYRF